MKNIAGNVLGSKFTSGLGAVIAVFSLLGIEGDPATIESVHQFLSANANGIAQVVAVIALFLAKDPDILTKPKNNQEAIDERIKDVAAAEVGRLLTKIDINNPTQGEGK